MTCFCLCSNGIICLYLLWSFECSIFTASSFRIWKSSTVIPSPPLTLFVVMLSKAHLTSHSRMPGKGPINTINLVIQVDFYRAVKTCGWNKKVKYMSEKMWSWEATSPSASPRAHSAVPPTHGGLLWAALWIMYWVRDCVELKPLIPF